MKNMKKLLVLALVIVSVLAIAAPALAAPAYESRYSDRELYTNTPAGYSWAIRNLQRDLNDYGNYGLSVDGYFGPRTKEAVQDFQRDHGLGADGRVGPQTKEKLWERYGD